MPENFNQQQLPASSEELQNASLKSYLGKIASGVVEVSFISSAIVGTTEIASRIMGEGDHLSIPVATAMATAIFASNHRKNRS